MNLDRKLAFSFCTFDLEFKSKKLMRNTFTEIDSKGRQVFFREWTPENTVIASIVLIHGLGEHSGRYDHVAAFFTKHGFYMLAPDTFGHGNTPGKRGHTSKMEDYLDLVDFSLKQARRKFPEKPVVLYGHSMGGLICLKYETTNFVKPNLLVLTSPALGPGFKVPAIKLLAGKIGKMLLPSLSQANGLDVQGLSRDKAVIEAYINDPLVHDRLSAEVGMGILEWGSWYVENVESVSIPILVEHGSEDKITNFELSQRKFANMQGDITFEAWTDYKHELHNEEIQEQLFQHILHWIFEYITH